MACGGGFQGVPIWLHWAIKRFAKTPQERFVQTIQNECTDKMIFFGEKHLRYVVSQFRTGGPRRIRPPTYPMSYERSVWDNLR